MLPAVLNFSRTTNILQRQSSSGGRKVGGGWGWGGGGMTLLRCNLQSLANATVDVYMLLCPCGSRRRSPPLQSSLWTKLQKHLFSPSASAHDQTHPPLSNIQGEVSRDIFTFVFSVWTDPLHIVWLCSVCNYACYLFTRPTPRTTTRVFCC